MSCVKSAERGSSVTIICAMRVTGLFVRPAVVIPRKRTRPELVDSAPLGSLQGASKVPRQTYLSVHNSPVTFKTE